MLFKASAPGSLMLLGEYAVLHGGQALVAAVNRRMSVTLTPRADNEIRVSSALGRLQTNVSQIEIAPPFQFVLAALKKYKNKLKKGCDISIASEFSHEMGFASSAAVTVAMVAVLSSWLDNNISEKKLIHSARDIVQSVQGTGSGADVAACVLGGIVAYRADPCFAKKLAGSCPISVVYSGTKLPTVDAIARVEQRFAAQPNIFKKLLAAIDRCAREGIIAVENQHWAVLGDLMNIQQGLMDALGVNTPVLNKIVTELRENPAILGAKISGSGFGDCVIGLGAADEESAAISQQGVMCEKN